ncbi:MULTISPECIES: TlpA family protein disulfide reductase [unclassified Campylobacter]|uniref:TlpA family protein disulfide reductase n=1 Tax=unclassified Campylobacter TaxID=2593542 RepID=UPI0022E999F6|nr:MULTISPECIES: TlpA disulfide reductase family protein [unclassified Campylobacter]MDA3066162.1 TlpA family protein disulfide reductase [Campylobacter sp. CN_NE4]MDA3069429.1 TlpA family protein disulfide reductase [Campylobacter sp. CN_NE3]MDA3083379.1 TlpA family protein disulfide reductase [Campylobacter sp. CN_EL2]MDA3084910.1 TlpA family protein disulfide reductase [Campylobacter sp. CN_NE1]MDA3088016.1 TlpA family protein disulfide reductase [Campylobacter sp. CN_NA2]
MNITKILIIFAVVFAVAVYKSNTNKSNGKGNSAHYINSISQNDTLGDNVVLNLDSGKQISLQKSKDGFTMQNNNQPTLFVFFATWCPSCKKSVPFYLSLQKKCSNLRIVGALLEDKERSVIQKYKKTLNINYEITQSGARALERANGGVNAIPSLLLLDKNGITKHSGVLTPQNMQNFLSSIDKICG